MARCNGLGSQQQVAKAEKGGSDGWAMLGSLLLLISGMLIVGYLVIF
ncbi:MAG: hypothetical protein JWR10_2838 [Rubritepida sp.]|nr:hypothetical protein [Rubritepida sp.]